MGGRSKPGWGSIACIYVLGPAEQFADSDNPGHGNTSMYSHHGEDYADTIWPVVVKAKPEVSSEQLVEHLRDLADAIEKGFYLPIDPDRDTLEDVPVALR